MKEKVLIMHSRNWKCGFRVMGSGYWLYLLQFRLKAHKQASISFKTDSLLMPDTKIVSEVDELSDLSATTIGSPTPDSEA